MPELKPLTALGGAAPRTDTIGTVTIAEVPDIALASVAARLGCEAATAAALAGIIGADAPGPGHHAGRGDVTAFWLGPDQWMVMAPISSHEEIASMMAAAVKSNASVTEQSGAWVRFDLSGAGCVDMLERLCALPVRRMQAGEASRSRIEHLAAMVICHGGSFSVLGAGSSAGSLHHALMTAAQSVA